MKVQQATPPKNIFFYRDGVSEGEFEQVARNEIPLIKGGHVSICATWKTYLRTEAFNMCRIPEKHHPRLLFVIVGKRHGVLVCEARRPLTCP